MKRILAGAALAAATLMAASAHAATVDVVDTITGSAGNWTHDFSVTNNISGFDLYFFGVELDAHDITGSPAGFDPGVWPTWDNSPYGGSATVYNNNWLDSGFSLFPSGGSLSGFKVHDTNTVAETGIAWFAYAVNFGGSYNGADCFQCGYNPGFEGVSASVGGVPEPAAWALMVGGFGLAGAALRRRRVATAA